MVQQQQQGAFQFKLALSRASEAWPQATLKTGVTWEGGAELRPYLKLEFYYVLSYSNIYYL